MCCQFCHFFQAIFRKISFFKVSQDFRMFIFHFHEEMFFKCFYIFNRNILQ